MAINRVLTREHALRERLADDGDRLLILRIAFIEGATRGEWERRARRKIPERLPDTARAGPLDLVNDRDRRRRIAALVPSRHPARERPSQRLSC